jgi:hypothetical protein
LPPSFCLRLALCALCVEASATNPALTIASIAAQLNPPFYPAANALVLTATNAANVSTTPKTESREISNMQFSTKVWPAPQETCFNRFSVFLILKSQIFFV